MARSRIRSTRPPLAALAALSVIAVAPAARAAPIALVGGTLVDVSDFGRAGHDVADAVVVLDGDAVIAAGPAAQVAIPPRARTIDARGKFLVPGLIDGAGALRSQAFASAYLHDGVTTVYVLQNAPGGGEGEDAPPYPASPGPRIFAGAPVTGYSLAGSEPQGPMAEHRLHDVRLSHAQLVARIDELADHGARGIAIGHDVWPDQVDVIVAAARRRGLATTFELGFTGYPYAIRAGVGALIRLDRYQAAFAPVADQLAWVDHRQSPETSRPIAGAICAADPGSSEVSAFAAQLAASRTALMPMSALEATADALDVPNPWLAASASLIAPGDLDNPVDRATGQSAFLAGQPAERRDRLRRCAQHKADMNRRLHELGARFLAASATPAFGVMPGSGLHLELALLRRAGLTPREALAAATSNYADVYGWRDVGRIEPGRRADVIVLDADPRLDVSALGKIHSVVFRGAVIDRARLLRPAAPARR